MEEKFIEITNTINELAAKNPYITKEHISKARSMYNGDDRPLEVIKAELEALSMQIAEREKNKERSSNLENQLRQSNSASFQLKAQPNVSEISLDNKATSPSAFFANQDDQKDLQRMIDDALSEPEQETYNAAKSEEAERPKQFVKTTFEESSNIESPSVSDGGYGNVGALLALTVMFSIVTFIMAIFTMLAK